ncbi:MAG: hypothetical protein U1F53_17695 [Burkholderiaceae bacterium]
MVDELRRRVPVGAPFGTRWKTICTVSTARGEHLVAAAARIDAQGRRREQYWCDGVRLDASVLLRLTCAETECPHAVAVRAQWLAHQRRVGARPAPEGWGPRPLIVETAVAVGPHRFVARPARFPCFTPCPHGAHPPLTIDKTGYDLFDEGACIGGGVVETGGVRRPRFPTVRAAEAFVLARHLETLAALAAARDSSRPRRGPRRKAG